jgi:hypothetical protein
LWCASDFKKDDSRKGAKNHFFRVFRGLKSIFMLRRKNMKKMKITIGVSGQVTIAVEGAVGTECLVFTQAMEHSVGIVEKRTLCDVYHTVFWNPL